jgi:hypothetical protein
MARNFGKPVTVTTGRCYLRNGSSPGLNLLKKDTGSVEFGKKYIVVLYELEDDSTWPKLKEIEQNEYEAVDYLFRKMGKRRKKRV